MRIIVDTNIWYKLACNESLLNLVKDKQLCPNHINIIELCVTKNLIKEENLTRKAIQIMFHFKENVIYEPPFIHLAMLTNKDLTYNAAEEMEGYLKFTSLFAKGHKIAIEKIEDYLIWVKSKRNKFEEASAFFNKHADLIYENIKLRKQRKKENSIPSTANFINYIIKTITDEKFEIKGLALIEIELLLKTMDTFFRKIDISDIKIKPNDWYDMAILGYVRPGDKYWTIDGTWINLIKEAGCENYLYNPK
jgi:hypothetical protein